MLTCMIKPKLGSFSRVGGDEGLKTYVKLPREVF